MREKCAVRYSLIVVGVSVIVSIFAIYGFGQTIPSGGTSNNFIFGRIFNSLMLDGDSGVFGSVSLVKKEDICLQVSRLVKQGEVIMSLAVSDEIFSSPIVVDGVHNVPIELSVLSEFALVSLEARIVLCLVFSKLHADESSPLYLMWKGVGVQPIPDNRWIRHKGVFSLLLHNEEVSVSAIYLLNECFQFSKTHNLHKQYGITEVELKWGIVMVNAFGIMVEGVKVFVPPLVFARHTVYSEDSVIVRMSNLSVEVVARREMPKGSEIFIDGSQYVSDVWRLLYHGSWDDSLHRMILQNGVVYSNDVNEQKQYRLLLPNTDLEEARKRVSDLQELLTSIEKTTHTNNMSEPIQRIQYIHFGLVLNEFIFAQQQLDELKIKYTTGL